MADFKKKLHDEIVALEYELRNELPKEILKVALAEARSKKPETAVAENLGKCSAKVWRIMGDATILVVTKN